MTLEGAESVGTSIWQTGHAFGNLIRRKPLNAITTAEYSTSVVNDDIQNTNLQGHAGTLAECTPCHASTPNTVTGGPHGLHPIGTSWVDTHHDVAEQNGSASCQPCHGVDYCGTILSKVQARDDHRMGAQERTGHRVRRAIPFQVRFGSANRDPESWQPLIWRSRQTVFQMPCSFERAPLSGPKRTGNDNRVP
jgi:hypothetical protein